MRIKLALLGIIFPATINVAWAQEPHLGQCDASANRDEETAQFIVDSRNDTDADFAAKRPCTDEPVHIKKCAVISVESDSFQVFCHNTGRPTYYEDVEVVHYWGPHAVDTPAK